MNPSPFALHLNTNYIPTQPEVDAIRGIIDARKVDVDAIDKRLAELDRQRMELEAERSIHTEFIAKHYALTTMARTLPEDILSALFTTLRSISAPMTSPHPSVVVSHVCRRWRDISLRTHVLWVDIEVYTPRPASDDAVWEDRWAIGLETISDMMTTFFGRSASYPLSLWLDVQDLGPNMFGQMKRIGEDNPMIPFLSALSLCMSKTWQRTIISSRVNTIQPNLSLTLPAIFASLSKDSGVGAREIAVDVTYMDGGEVHEDVWRHSTHEMFDYAFQAPFSTLTIVMEIDILRHVQANWGALTTLAIGNRRSSGDLWANYILSALSQTQNLVTLTLEVPRCVYWDSSVPHPEAVILAKVHSFTIRGFYPTEALIESLDFPHLKRLSMLPTAPLNVPIQWHAGDILRFGHAARFGKDLVELEVNCGVIPPRSLPCLLQRLPNIQSLELAAYDASVYQSLSENSILNQITPAFNEERTELAEVYLCPNLSEFRVELVQVGPEVRESIMKLVEARRSVKKTGGPVAWLERIEVVHHERWSEGMLEELTTRGVSTRGVFLGLRSR